MKLPEEAERFARWAGQPLGVKPRRVEIVQRHLTALHVEDADSEVLFEAEKAAVTRAEYEAMRRLVLKSAVDFERLYRSLPDADATDIAPRSTLYGQTPRTATEMYAHTNQVTAYYLGEIGVDGENLPDLPDNRAKALEALEAIPGFLECPPQEGAFGEWWSLRKVMRRFVWHDRIHAKAMYRMAVRMWGEAEDVFCFSRR